MAVGAVAGTLAGAVRDYWQAGVALDFVEEAEQVLRPGKVAVIAEVEEDWTAPVDTRMEKLGGTVYRRALSAVRDTANDEDTAAIKAEMAQMKLEHAQAHADRKAKLQERLSQLDSKLQARLQQAKERRQLAERAAEAKVAFLRTKATEAKAKAP